MNHSNCTIEFVFFIFHIVIRYNHSLDYILQTSQQMNTWLIYIFYFFDLHEYESNALNKNIWSRNSESRIQRVLDGFNLFVLKRLLPLKNNCSNEFNLKTIPKFQFSHKWIIGIKFQVKIIWYYLHNEKQPQELCHGWVINWKQYWHSKLMDFCFVNQFQKSIAANMDVVVVAGSYCNADALLNRSSVHYDLIICCIFENCISLHE